MKSRSRRRFLMAASWAARLLGATLPLGLALARRAARAAPPVSAAGKKTPRWAELNRLLQERGYLSVEEKYEMLFLESGPPSKAVPVDPAYAESYRGRLPDVLLRMWVEHGWGGWQRGRFWTADPAFLQPVIDFVFEGDPDYDPRGMLGFAYDCFGTLYAWRGERRVMKIKLLARFIFESQEPAWDEFAKLPVTDDDALLASLKTRPTDPDHDYAWPWTDENGRDMHALAVERLGELEKGEIYGFVPALAAGGANRVENLKRVPLVEHLAILIEWERPVIYRYELPKPGEAGFGAMVPLRPAGAPGR